MGNKTEAGGGSGGGGGGSYSGYECNFCGAVHIRGMICPNLVKLITTVVKSLTKRR